jgi:hypothetical protein
MAGALALGLIGWIAEGYAFHPFPHVDGRRHWPTKQLQFSPSRRSQAVHGALWRWRR